MQKRYPWMLATVLLLASIIIPAKFSVPAAALEDSEESPGILLGAHIPPVDPSFGPNRLYYWQEVETFNQIVGHRHPIIMYYSDLTSGFGGYLLKFGGKSEFSSELEVLFNFDESDDWRVNFVNSVTTTMTDVLALKVSYAMLYDNQPVLVFVSPDADAPAGTPDAPFEFDELDTILTASLVINF